MRTPSPIRKRSAVPVKGPASCKAALVTTNVEPQMNMAQSRASTARRLPESEPAQSTKFLKAPSFSDFYRLPGSVTSWSSLEPAHVVLERLLRAREGHLGPRQLVSREALYGQRLIQGCRLAACLTGGEDGDGRDLALVGVEAHDAGGLYRQAGLLQSFALGGNLGDLAALDEASGEGPLSVARLDGALYQEYAAVEFDDGPDDQLRPQIEHEAALRAHQALRLAFFKEAGFEASGTEGTESVFRRFHRMAFKSVCLTSGSTVLDAGSSEERFACSPDTPHRNDSPGCAPRSRVCRVRSTQRQGETRPILVGNPRGQPHPGARITPH